MLEKSFIINFTPKHFHFESEKLKLRNRREIGQNKGSTRDEIELNFNDIFQQPNAKLRNPIRKMKKLFESEPDRIKKSESLTPKAKSATQARPSTSSGLRINEPTPKTTSTIQIRPSTTIRLRMHKNSGKYIPDFSKKNFKSFQISKENCDPGAFGITPVEIPPFQPRKLSINSFSESKKDNTTSTSSNQCQLQASSRPNSPSSKSTDFQLSQTSSHHQQLGSEPNSPVRRCSNSQPPVGSKFSTSRTKISRPQQEIFSGTTSVETESFNHPQHLDPEHTSSHGGISCIWEKTSRKPTSIAKRKSYSPQLQRGQRSTSNASSASESSQTQISLPSISPKVRGSTSQLSLPVNATFAEKKCESPLVQNSSQQQLGPTPTLTISKSPSPHQQVGFTPTSTVSESPSSQKQITPKQTSIASNRSSISPSQVNSSSSSLKAGSPTSQPSSPATVSPTPIPHNQVAESSSSYKSAKKYLFSKFGFGSKKSRSFTVQEKLQAQSVQSNKIVHVTPTVSVESENEKIYSFRKDNAYASTGLQTPDSGLSFSSRHTIAASSLRDYLPSDAASSSTESNEDLTARLSPPPVKSSSRFLDTPTTSDFARTLSLETSRMTTSKEEYFRGSVIDMLLKKGKMASSKQTLSPTDSEIQSVKPRTESNSLKPGSKTSWSESGSESTLFSPKRINLLKRLANFSVATDEIFKIDEEYSSFIQTTRQMTQFETPESVLASVKREAFSVLMVSSWSYITFLCIHFNLCIYCTLEYSCTSVKLVKIYSRHIDTRGGVLKDVLENTF